jgi:hypothetical protein
MSRQACATLGLAALLAAAPLSSQGLVYQGSVAGATNPFIGKFAFGVDPSGAAVGNVALTYSVVTVRARCERGSANGEAE